MSERCEHHGEDLVLYCPVCRPSHAELQVECDELETLWLNQEKLVKRLDAALAELQNNLSDKYWVEFIEKARLGGMTPGHETPVVTAKREIAEEEYREAVEREKARIRAYRPWYHRIFPFTITITRRK